MRPISISMQGLRSYREPCVIDFSGRSLVAIVGDTGAGKSSILEGITYALYNATTWSSGEVKLLIANGLNTMKVRFEFEAAGQRWVVERSSSVKNYPPSIHKLSCLGDASFVPVDSERSVNDQITRLLGMSHKAFLACVILPQGRFQKLLTAEGNDRTDILEGLFRLRELKELRGKVQELRNRADPAFSQLAGMRAGLMPDPSAVADVLALELETISARQAELSALQAAVVKADAEAREAAATAKALRDPAAKMLRVQRGASEVLGSLVPLARELEGRKKEVEVSLATLRERAAQQGEELESAREARETLADVAAALAVLTSLERDVTAVGAGRVVLEGEERAIAEDAIKLAAQEGQAKLLRSKAESSQRVLESSQAAVDAAAASMARGQDLLREARAALAQSDRARTAAAGQVARIPELEATVTTRRSDAVKATAKAAQAAAALERAQRADAAAHAASGLKPGDECPVCGEVLSARFTPPNSGPLAALEKAAKTAAMGKGEADTALAVADNALSVARAQLASIQAEQIRADAAA